MRLVSADSHLEAPLQAWCEPALREELRRVLSGAVLEHRFSRSHLGAQIDVSFEQQRDESDAAPEQRIDDMDTDGVAAEVLYPPLLFDALSAVDLPRELAVTLATAYNTWLGSRFCAANPARLAGLAVLPTCGTTDAIAELTRVSQLPGIAGVALHLWPNGSGLPEPEDLAFWAEAEAQHVPLTFHIGFGGGMRAEREAGRESLAYLLAPFASHSEYVIAQLITSGIFDRFPSLRIAAGETGVGWLQFFLEQVDLNFTRYKGVRTLQMQRAPSEYVESNLLLVMQEDRFGLRTLDPRFARCIMWGSDYPHMVSNWPSSVQLMHEQLMLLPPEHREAFAHGTADEFYGLSAELAEQVA